jgi:hypothetical protein
MIPFLAKLELFQVLFTTVALAPGKLAFLSRIRAHDDRALIPAKKFSYWTSIVIRFFVRKLLTDLRLYPTVGLTVQALKRFARRATETGE